MSERNELKHVFRQLRTSSGDPVEETNDKEDMEKPKISVITLEQPKAVHNDALERKLDEFERQTKKAAAKMKNIEPVEKQAKRYGNGSVTKVQLKKRVVPQPESSSDSDTDEGKKLRGTYVYYDIETMCGDLKATCFSREEAEVSTT